MVFNTDPDLPVWPPGGRLAAVARATTGQYLARDWNYQFISRWRSTGVVARSYRLRICRAEAVAQGRVYVLDHQFAKSIGQTSKPVRTREHPGF